MTTELNNFIPSLIALAKEASKKILEIYQQENFEIISKTDNTPLTQADLLSHSILEKGLSNLMPNYHVLSEESVSIPFKERQRWNRYWLIDPLDGTKEFIERTADFSINIALIEKHQPILGLIYVPLTHSCMYAIRGEGTFEWFDDGRTVVNHTHQVKKDKMMIVISRHYNPKKFSSFLKKIDQYEVKLKGSALKFLSIAKGEADIYPRFGKSCEWDTAAGQCIVEEAGGEVMDFKGNVLKYNTQESLFNPEFIVVGNKKINWAKLFLQKKGE